jgi:mycothiol synthase
MSRPYSGQVELRAFQADDLEPIVSLWNDCLLKDQISIERFWRLFLLDPNYRPEGAIVATADGKTVGYLQAIVSRTAVGIYPADQAQGWITVFFVSPAYRRFGIGRKLILAGLEFLRQHGCRAVSCNGYSPFYAFPGVDVEYAGALALLEGVGFQVLNEPVAMELSLKNVTTPALVAERRSGLATAGIVARPFELSDTLPLLAFVGAQFPYWHQCLIDGLQLDRDRVFVACRGADEFLGFAQWENPQTDPPDGAIGRFGPFGVHADWRGKGLGSVMFYSLIEHLRAEGASRIWFGWAGGRNLVFYTRVGCRITRQYRMFGLEL